MRVLGQDLRAQGDTGENQGCAERLEPARVHSLNSLLVRKRLMEIREVLRRNFDFPPQVVFLRSTDLVADVLLHVRQDRLFLTRKIYLDR